MEARPTPERLPLTETPTPSSSISTVRSLSVCPHPDCDALRGGVFGGVADCLLADAVGRDLNGGRKYRKVA
jgi:hypothetical protein